MRTIAKLCAVVLLVGIGLSFLDSPLADPCQRNPVWTETTSLPADRAGAGAEVSPHNWVYVACGSGPGYMTSVIGAPIDPETGELGEWIEMTSLPISRVHPALHWWNGYLYAAGGYNAGSGSLYNVHSAPVHQDGTIGDWTEQGSLAVAHNGENHSFIRDGKLCLISCGASHTPPVVRIQVAELLADGQLGGWTVIMTLQTERYYPVAVATDTHLFLIAGDLGLDHRPQMLRRHRGVHRQVQHQQLFVGRIVGLHLLGKLLAEPRGELLDPTGAVHLPDRLGDPVPEVLRVQFAPARLRLHQRIVAVGQRDLPARQVERDRLAPRRPDVYAEQAHLSSSAFLKIPLVLQIP